MHEDDPTDTHLAATNGCGFKLAERTSDNFSSHHSVEVLYACSRNHKNGGYILTDTAMLSLQQYVAVMLHVDSTCAAASTYLPYDRIFCCITEVPDTEVMK